jgi:cytochrome c peroxidase
LSRLNTPAYREGFKAAYGDSSPNMNNVVRALASYVRSLVSFNSSFDKYAYAGDDYALTPQQIRGLNLFFSERTECFHCHGGVNFTQSSKHSSQSFADQPFHNTGMYNTDGMGSYPKSDMGLYSVTHNKADMGKFRAPTLRNIALTAPYMHDGSIETLEDVVAFYARGGNKRDKINPYRSPFIKGFRLTESEQAALIAFLHSLTDDKFIDTHKVHKKE